MKNGASKVSQRSTIQLTMCYSALISPLTPLSADLKSALFFLNPKHSTALLVHCQIPLFAGPNLLVWCIDESWREASGCSIWLLSGRSCLWDVTESSGTRQQNTKSMRRVYLGNPKSMCGCLTSAAWIHEGSFFILSACYVAKDWVISNIEGDVNFSEMQTEGERKIIFMDSTQERPAGISFCYSGE